MIDQQAVLDQHHLRPGIARATLPAEAMMRVSKMALSLLVLTLLLSSVGETGEVYQEDPDGEFKAPDHPLGGFWYWVIYDKPDGASSAAALSRRSTPCCHTAQSYSET